tara:strand:+ start:91 stop:507 length:417 start_codon:yes stop_codon:yes gene_type:complete
MIIDATDIILGRLAAFAAKKSLLGNKVDIINCERSVISGKKATILARYKKRSERGTPSTGPFIKRKPADLVKRSIRDMLPYKTSRGRDAFKNIKAHAGMPDVFKDKKLTTFEGAHKSKMKNVKYITINDVSAFLGGNP